MCSRKWEANPYVVPSAEPRFFSGEGGTRGVYSKFQALGGAIIRSGALIWSSALKILTHWDRGDSHITRTARSTVTIKPLNEINLGMAQDFFDKGDQISSNTVWQCVSHIKVFLDAVRMRLVEILSCPKRYYWYKYWLFVLSTLSETKLYNFYP